MIKYPPIIKGNSFTGMSSMLIIFLKKWPSLFNFIDANLWFFWLVESLHIFYICPPQILNCFVIFCFLICNTICFWQVDFLPFFVIINYYYYYIFGFFKNLILLVSIINYTLIHYYNLIFLIFSTLISLIAHYSLMAYFFPCIADPSSIFWIVIFLQYLVMSVIFREFFNTLQ